MATFQTWKKKDGSTSYRAIIRKKREGKIVHSESETFSKKKDAELWAKKREVALSDNDFLDKVINKKEEITVKRLIELYEEKVKPIKGWGRSKQAVLESWKNRDYGETLAHDVDSSWLIEYAMYRSSVEGAQGPTITQDLSFLRSVFAVAKDILGVQVSVAPFVEAIPTLKKLNLHGKGKKRDRRPEVDEITDIVERAYNNRHSPHGRAHDFIPLDKILVFQMFSGRRISETCRLRWSDLDKEKQRILVRDMKDPGAKKGNDVWVNIPDEAYKVLLTMPEKKDEDRIFPYDSKSVGTNFQRNRDKCGYYYGDRDKNLSIHDLRHECLSWLAEKNGLPGEHWDLPRLQSVSGHRGWSSLEIYVKLLDTKPTDKWANWEWKTKVLD